MHHAGKCVPLTRSLARTQTHTQTHTHTPARSHTCMCALHRRCPTPLAAGGLAHRRAIKREQAGVVLGASGAGLPGRVPRARCGSPRAADTHHSLHWPSWYFSLLGRDNTACVALTHKSAACARGPEGDGLRVRKIARAGRRQAACTCAVRSTRVRAAHRHAPPSPRPRATYVTWRGPPLGQRALPTSFVPGPKKNPQGRDSILVREPHRRAIQRRRGRRQVLPREREIARVRGGVPACGSTIWGGHRGAAACMQQTLAHSSAFVPAVMGGVLSRGAMQTRAQAPAGRGARARGIASVVVCHPLAVPRACLPAPAVNANAPRLLYSRFFDSCSARDWHNRNAAWAGGGGMSRGRVEYEALTSDDSWHDVTVLTHEPARSLFAWRG